MPDLFAALDVFLQEHRCGELDGGVDGRRIGWRATAERPSHTEPSLLNQVWKTRKSNPPPPPRWCKVDPLAAPPRPS